MLEKLFSGLDVDVGRGEQLAGKLDSGDSYPRGPGRVQYALLG